MFLKLEISFMNFNGMLPKKKKKIDHHPRVTGSNHHKASTGFHFVVISQESLKLVHTIGAS